MRIDYDAPGLSPSDLGDDPTLAIEQWLVDAELAGPYDPTAACLSTVGENGLPSARMVLVRGFDQDRVAFKFFTSYVSRKAGELSTNSGAALVFYWPMLHRQLRIVGRAERLSAAESDAYFATRPRTSQINARASQQSAVIGTRNALEARVRAEEAGWAVDAQPERPRSWGGYAVIADEVEFWVGRPGRLHDRIAFHRAGMGMDDHDVVEDWQLVTSSNGVMWRRARLQP